MKLKVSYQGISPDGGDAVETRISNWIGQHLEPIMQGIGFAGSELAVVIGKRKKGGDKWNVKLHMHVPPRKIIAVHGDGDDLWETIEAALKRLLRKVEKHISRVRHQESYKRKARRARLRMMKAKQGELPADIMSEAVGGIETLLPRLEKAIKRELVYLRSQGDLPPDYPTVQDVIDEVVARVQGNWAPGADSHAAYLQLLQAMHKVLDEEVANSRVFGEMESLESKLPEDAEDQSEDMVEEEIQEFWQPDELLSLEDVVEDKDSIDPELVTEEAEEAEEADAEAAVLLGLMKELPIQWRRALMLKEFEKLADAEVAIPLEQDVASVTVWIDAANRFLVARLQQAGFASIPERPLTLLKLPE
ncbi:MAG TPA: hypothetical protein ENJ35_07935 [Gammaproteobacteria bacterium]|nr:hypothetical protein [Gammaproteobacteria bacterium]